MPQRHELIGRIAAVGFASGDRVVIGVWDRSPVGPFADVMWAEPDGRRVLYGDALARAFVTAVYDFDAEVDAPVATSGHGDVLDVRFDAWSLRLRRGRAVPFPPRPAWVTRYVEGPIARRTMGVSTFGVAPSGVREWYRARTCARLRDVDAEGPRSLGAVTTLRPRCGFGFSEPPAFASITEVRPLLFDPSGRLDAVLASLRAPAR